MTHGRDDMDDDVKLRQKLNAIWAEGLAELTASGLITVFGCSDDTESPIERLMLAALQLIEAPLYFPGHIPHPLVKPTLLRGPPGFADPDGDPFPHLLEYGLLYPQANIGRYRADFLVIAKFEGRGPYRIVVECDGHEFHERTKEQAERDRSRDRSMTSAGYQVLRFTGREIWRDALSCAREVERLLSRIEADGRQLHEPLPEAANGA